MPKVYNEDGEEVKDVVTKEEHETQLAAAAAKALKDATDAGVVFTKDAVQKEKDAVAKLQADLTKAQEDLAKLGEKDVNFKNLREAKEAAESKVKELTDTLNKKIGEIEHKIDTRDLDGAIRGLADDDAEMEKKIRYHFQRLSKADDTAEQRAKNLEDAATLAVGKRRQVNLINGMIAFSSDGSHKIQDGADSSPLSDNVKQLGARLGLSDKDMNKYGKK